MLSLSQNEFFGRLPKNLTYFSLLERLDLHDNKISGEIPSFLSQIPSLRVLSLQNNSFGGSISNDLSNLTNLQILDLSNNNLTGKIPPFGNLQGMTHNLDVSSVTSDNSFTFPMEVQDFVITDHDFEIIWKKSKRSFSFRNIGVFCFLDLSNNKLCEQIPSSLGNLKSLKSLNISYNLLSGRIPYSFGGLKNLEAFDMSHNNLLGQIPKTFANFGQLNFLDLNNNKLVGPIPSGPQMDTLDDLNNPENNSGLCGVQIRVLWQQNSTTTESAESNNIDEQWFSCKVAGISFPFGILITFIAVYQTHYLAPSCSYIYSEKVMELLRISIWSCSWTY